MKERPILFSGPMVRAILEGRKTQTRRTHGLERFNASPNDWRYSGADALGFHMFHVSFPIVSRLENGGAVARCPYGQPGDRLWVRETFSTETIDGVERIAYRADIANGYNFLGWRPSIFMPRTASRITLENAAVRVERVQDVSAADKEAEGLTNSHGYGPAAFEALWDQINAKRGYSWESNPWVWVVEFKKL